MQIVQQDDLTNFVSCSLLHSWLGCEHTWGAVPGILSPSSSQISLSLFTNTDTNSDTNTDTNTDTKKDKNTNPNTNRKFFTIQQPSLSLSSALQT
jgi:hypothetical protein